MTELSAATPLTLIQLKAYAVVKKQAMARKAQLIIRGLIEAPPFLLDEQVKYRG